MNEIVCLEPRAITAADFAARITTTYRRSVEAIIETGRLIAEAKLALDHGEFLSMVENKLPFDPRTAQMLMKIAGDHRITDANHGSLLPPHWRTLYELTKLSDAAFEARLADRTINPQMERRDITLVAKRERRQMREVALADRQRALPEKKYGVIYADPEWRFKPWSDETGMDRAADNHYRTSLYEQIAERPVPTIADQDCVLFLWGTPPMLLQALAVMGEWGFQYKTHCVWVKDRIGLGYWVRAQHEILLIGTRGNVLAPAAGEQWSSVIDARRGVHSSKPAAVYELIEQLFPNLPKIELNARGPARPGWDVWGDEAVGSDDA